MGWRRKRGRQRGRDDGERGSAVVFVSMFGLVAILVVLGLVGGLAVEARAVEDSLAQIRTYWAAQGASSYVLSRTRYASPCPNKSCPGGNNPNPPPAQIAAYLNELQGAFGNAAPGALTWLYPERGANYGFYVSASANPDNLAPQWSNGGAKSGEYCLRFTFQALMVGATGPAAAPKAAGACSGLAATAPGPVAPAPDQGQPIEALRSLARMRPVEVRFCVVGNPAMPCGCTAGNASQSSACQNSNGFDGTLPFQRVTSVHRPSG